MLKVRLQRVGRKNDPAFRVVVTDSRKGPKTRNYIELLGSYNPRQKTVSINGERIKYWMSVGAQASNTVHNILVNEKVIDKKKINVLPKKSPIVKEKPKEEEKKETEASVESKETTEDKKNETETAKEEVKKEATKEATENKPEEKQEEKSTEEKDTEDKKEG